MDSGGGGGGAVINVQRAGNAIPKFKSDINGTGTAGSPPAAGDPFTAAIAGNGDRLQAQSTAAAAAVADLRAPSPLAVPETPTPAKSSGASKAAGSAAALLRAVVAAPSAAMASSSALAQRMQSLAALTSSLLAEDDDSDEDDFFSLEGQSGPDNAATKRNI
ncbi:unnamed protein product [Phaeothamnion confervicola]